MSLAAGSDAQAHLSVRSLSIAFGGQREYAVDGLSFDLNKGECLGLVGESGSGKSLTALAAMQLLPNAARVGQSSQLYFNGEDILGLSERKMRAIRGRQISMVFQDALTALNPVYTIGQQLSEIILTRQKKRVALRLLDEVGIKDVQQCYNSYPHQLSGGMRQRALIAMALAGEPQLLIADEPTTALDVTVQAQVVELLKRIRAQRQMSLLFISHDLALVAQLADNVVVMKSGRLQEQGPVEAVFYQPQSEYTRRLLSAIPDGSIGQAAVEQAEPVLNVHKLHVHFPIKKGIMKRTVGQVKAVDDVSFELSAGQTLAIVGESGSGKTTCALALLRLLEATSGTVQFNGKSLFQSNLKQLRLDMQIVFQDPYSSLNPRRQVGDSIAEGLFAQRRVRSRREAMKQVDALLQQVQMPVDIKHRYPHEFSGGQRQRLCIARALALRPKVLILDEPTSALDVSIQKQVLELLLQLQQQHNLAYLLITHDLGVVAQVAHRVVVMNQGKVVESGSVTEVLQNPQQLYTQQLVSAMPTMTK